MQEAVEKLEALGFLQHQARAAVGAVGLGEAGGAAAALDWLLLRVPNEELPATFQSGAQQPLSSFQAAGMQCWPRLRHRRGIVTERRTY